LDDEMKDWKFVASKENILLIVALGMVCLILAIMIWLARPQPYGSGILLVVLVYGLVASLSVTIPLFLLALLLAFSDFFALGTLAYGVGVHRGATGLVLVVVETSVRAFLVFGLFVLVLKAYNVPESRIGWLKYVLVTTVICGVPPMTLSVYLNNYVLFQLLGLLLSDLPFVLFGLLFLPLNALVLEFPRLLLAQRIWQMLVPKAGHSEKEVN